MRYGDFIFIRSAFIFISGIISYIEGRCYRQQAEKQRQLPGGQAFISRRAQREPPPEAYIGSYTFTEQDRHQGYRD